MRSILTLILAAASAAAQTVELSTEERTFVEVHFVAAKSAEAVRDFPLAASEYETILKRFPKAVPEVYQNAGIVYYLGHRYEAAIDRFTRGIQLNPAMVGSRLFLGISYVITGKPEKGLPHLEYAHKQKQSGESTTYLGLAHMDLRHYGAASRYLRAALEMAEQKDSLLYLIGDTYLKNSERTANTLAEQNPDSKYDHLVSARILDGQDFYQIAAKAYLDAGKKDPNHAPIFLRLARLLAILGQDAPAELALERYRKLAPADATATIDRANLPKSQIAAVGMKIDYAAELQALPAPAPLFIPSLNSDVNGLLLANLLGPQKDAWKRIVAELANGAWKSAAAMLQALRAVPGDWLRDYLLASSHLSMENPEKAGEAADRITGLRKPPPAVEMLRWEILQQVSFAYFSRLLEDFPQSARAHFLKARTLDAQGKREAQDEYLAALAAEPALTDVRIALADYYLSNSRYQEALAECEKALETDAWSSPAKLRIGRVYVQLRQPDKGLPYLLAGIETDPSNAEAHTDLGRAYELTGEREKAIAEYQLALKIDPSLNRIHYVLGRMYRNLGRTELADREYQIFQQNEASERQKHRERLRQALGSQAVDEKP